MFYWYFLSYFCLWFYWIFLSSFLLTHLYYYSLSPLPWVLRSELNLLMWKFCFFIMYAFSALKLLLSTALPASYTFFYFKIFTKFCVFLLSFMYLFSALYFCNPWIGLQITADGDCSHEIKRHLLLGRKIMTNLDSILRSRDITLSTNVRLVKAMFFPVVMYGCESWTIKKAECRRIDV